MKEIKHDLWYEVFSAMLFFDYMISVKKNPDKLNLVRSDFKKEMCNRRNLKKIPDIDTNSNLMMIPYLLILRTLEILKKHKWNKDDESLFWNFFKKNNKIKDFEDLMCYYELKINKKGGEFPKNEYEILFWILRKIRNSMAHVDYEYFNDYNIKFKDEKHGDFECIMPTGYFFQFTIDSVSHVSDFLIKEKKLYKE